jgi:hypothetical protein
MTDGAPIKEAASTNAADVALAEEETTAICAEGRKAH